MLWWIKGEKIIWHLENVFKNIELGKLLHISRQTISKWESNQSSPDIQSCKAMADVFGISLEELLYERKK